MIPEECKYTNMLKSNTIVTSFTIGIGSKWDNTFTKALTNMNYCAILISENPEV